MIKNAKAENIHLDKVEIVHMLNHYTMKTYWRVRFHAFLLSVLVGSE